jgi:hypothetical protein
MNKLLLPSRILNHKIISVQNEEKKFFLFMEKLVKIIRIICKSETDDVKMCPSCY